MYFITILFSKWLFHIYNTNYFLSPCPSPPQCMQGVISGIMRATGRQAIVAVVNFFCYYALGLPLGITLALKLDLKAKGIWIGLGAADFVQVHE